MQNQGCFPAERTPKSAVEKSKPRANEMTLVVTGPESKRREWHMAVVARVRFEEEQGDSMLVTCADNVMDLALRMAQACDVTLQIARFGDYEYGPLSVEHGRFVTIAKYSWESYEVIHLGSDGWKWGLIHDNGHIDMGTVRPGPSAEAQGGGCPRQSNGCFQSKEASGNAVQN